MREKAEERFSVARVDQIANEVTIQIETLEDTAEYRWLKGLKSILLYDEVKAYNERIGLDITLYVSEWEFDIIREKITGLKLKDVMDFGGRTVTGYNVQNNSIGPEKLTDRAKTEMIQQAVDMMPEYANPGSGTGAQQNTATDDGYVLKGGTNYGKVWKTDGNGVPAWRDDSDTGAFMVREAGVAPGGSANFITFTAPGAPRHLIMCYAAYMTHVYCNALDNDTVYTNGMQSGFTLTKHNDTYTLTRNTTTAFNYVLLWI